MNFKFTTCGFCLYFSLAAGSSLFGVHVHHSSHENTKLQIHAQAESENGHCVRHCKEENFLQHVLDDALNANSFEFNCVHCSYTSIELNGPFKNRNYPLGNGLKQSTHNRLLRNVLQPQAPPRI